MLIKMATVDTDDLLLVFENFDRPVKLAAPLLSAESVGIGLAALLEGIDADRLRVQLEILRAENDGSLKYRQAIAFLQGRFWSRFTRIRRYFWRTIRTRSTRRRGYRISWRGGSNVWITIYDTRGAIVRRLELGYRAEGYYRVRGRAAHWDGRNTVGERV